MSFRALPPVMSCGGYGPVIGINRQRLSAARRVRRFAGPQPLKIKPKHRRPNRFFTAPLV